MATLMNEVIDYFLFSFTIIDLPDFVCDAAMNFKIVWPHTPSGTPSYKIWAVDAIGQEIHIMSNEEKTGNWPFWKNTNFEIL